MPITEAPFSGNGDERSTKTARQRQLRARLASLEIWVRLDFHHFHAAAGLGDLPVLSVVDVKFK